MSSPVPSSSDAKQAYRQALQKVEELHGNMGVLAKLGVLLREPNSSADDVARLLQSDGALCANIIRTSNSAIYGYGTRSGNIHEALVKVGYNRVLSLVGASLSKRLFMRDLTAYGMSADDYWAYSYFCALFLERTAPRLGYSADDAYMLGLLHAIGRVVINDLLARTRVEVFWDRALPSEEWEEVLIGFRHDEAGAHLLRQWKFSPEVYERVARQKSPAAIAADPFLLLLDYARQCAELNHYHLGAPVWLAPEDHPWTRHRDFDPDQNARDIEQARQACLSIGEALKAT